VRSRSVARDTHTAAFSACVPFRSPGDAGAGIGADRKKLQRRIESESADPLAEKEQERLAATASSLADRRSTWGWIESGVWDAMLQAAADSRGEADIVQMTTASSSGRTRRDLNLHAQCRITTRLHLAFHPLRSALEGLAISGLAVFLERWAAQ
jgi:hypothetical protein